MRKRIFLVAAVFLFSLQLALAQPPPVKYLTGKSESGLPHLFWFGAAAVESSLYYDIGTPKYFVYVADSFNQNQVLVRFSVPSRPCLIDSLLALISYSSPGGYYFGFCFVGSTRYRRNGSRKISCSRHLVSEVEP